MSMFKDVIRDDIKTFINSEEFSDIHKINGVEMPVQIDNNEQIEREKRLNQHMDGIYTKQMLVYVAASDFGKLPKYGSIFNLDGRIYTVTDAIDEGGVFSITLEANRG